MFTGPHVVSDYTYAGSPARLEWGVEGSFALFAFCQDKSFKKTLDNCASLAFHFLLKANSSKRGSTEKECSFKIKQLN